MKMTSKDKNDSDNTFCLVIPETITIENVSTLYNEIKQIEKKHGVLHLEIDLKNLREFDSSVIAFLNYVKRNHPDVSVKNASEHFEKLLEIFPLTQVGPDRAASREWLSFPRRRVEALADRFLGVTGKFTRFFMLLADEIYYTFLYLFNRKGIYPGEIWKQLFYMGYNSFPIVCVISFLVGLTISITSLEQLQRFGADIYLADLVGFGMIRELVPMMTGIILAGKIGASITAEIATMKVMEETDALKTMGIIPEKFLMVPRLIAITIGIPLLVALADMIGIFAGMLVSWKLSGITPNLFFNEMLLSVDLIDFLIGMMKTMVFGWIIVVSSGYKGFNVKQGAAEVGIATTQSVVLSISAIIVSDCIFAFLLY